MKIEPEKLLNPLDYSIFILELPALLSEKDLYNAAVYKIKNNYPGNLSLSKVFIEKNGNKSGSYIVLVVSNKMYEEKNLFPLLAIKRKIGKKSINCVIKSNHAVQCLEFKKGMLIRQKVILNADSDKTGDDEKIFFNSENFEVYDQEVFMSGNIDKNDLVPTALKNRFSFRTVVLLFMLIAVLSTFVLIVGKDVYRSSQRKKEIELQKKMELINKDKIAENQRVKLENLRREYMESSSSVKIKPLEALLILTNNLDENTEVSSVSLTGNLFRFDAVSKDSMAVLRNFERDPLVEECMLHQVRMINSKESYSISGKIVNQIESAPDSDINTRIKWYEERIDNYKYRMMQLGKCSISSIASYIRSLANACSCTVSNYQFIDNNSPERDTELSFSINTDKINVFELIGYISANEQLFDVTNLNLRVLDEGGCSLVFRINTGKLSGESDYVSVSDVENINADRNSYSSVAKYFQIRKKIAKTEYKSNNSSSSIIEERKIQKLPSNYVFIAKSLSGNNHVLFIKDSRSGTIKKFLHSKDSSDAGTFSESENDVIIINMDGKFYSLVVKK